MAACWERGNSRYVMISWRGKSTESLRKVFGKSSKIVRLALAAKSFVFLSILVETKFLELLKAFQKLLETSRDFQRILKDSRRFKRVLETSQVFKIFLEA
jgi:hypothetical protein